MRPPKNSTSVARNTQMPSSATSCCWRRSTNWKAAWGSRILRTRLAFDAVVVRIAPHFDCALEIVRGRRRRGLPFKTRRLPGVGWRTLAEKDRPREVEKRQEISDGQYRGANRRHHVPDLKLRRINVIAPRHPKNAEDELRKERHVEAEEDQDRCGSRPVLRIHPSGDLRPPVVQATEV